MKDRKKPQHRRDRPAAPHEPSGPCQPLRLFDAQYGHRSIYLFAYLNLCLLITAYLHDRYEWIARWGIFVLPFFVLPLIRFLARCFHGELLRSTSFNLSLLWIALVVWIPSSFGLGPNLKEYLQLKTGAHIEDVLLRDMQNHPDLIYATIKDGYAHYAYHHEVIQSRRQSGSAQSSRYMIVTRYHVVPIVSTNWTRHQPVHAWLTWEDANLFSEQTPVPPPPVRGLIRRYAFKFDEAIEEACQKFNLINHPQSQMIVYHAENYQAYLGKIGWNAWLSLGVVNMTLAWFIVKFRPKNSALTGRADHGRH